MTDLLRKLQYKDQGAILVLQAPDSFETDLKEWSDSATVATQAKADSYGMILAFAYQAADIPKLVETAVDLLTDDGLLWLAYAKKSSKTYQTDITRDHGWEPLGKHGFEAVRQVAIDADWSALRFRHIDSIKSFKRNKSRALSEKGKKRN